MDAETAAEVRRALEQAPLFSKLSGSEIDALLELARVVEYPARHEVFHKGDEGRQVFIVLSGRLKVVAPSRGDDVITLSIMEPGEIFGELALLGAGRRSATVATIDAVRLVAIDRREFLPVLERYPRLSIKLLEALSNRLLHISELIEDTTFLNLPSRLSKQLLQLARRFGVTRADGAIEIDLKLSQEELGDLVATTRESINKLIRAWTSEGLASMERGRVILHRPEKLEALADAADD